MGLNKPVGFPTAKLLKEKGFDEEVRDFYTKPNSKMFGIDEHYRNYPIKNISKKLYTVGVHCVLNIENVYPAPTIADVVMWLYEKHGIWVVSSYELNVETNKREWFWVIIKEGEEIAYQYKDFNSPTEAYQDAIDYVLKNLI
jgi:hypothetical protein